MEALAGCALLFVAGAAVPLKASRGAVAVPLFALLLLPVASSRWKRCTVAASGT
jgi:hypothetical protein